MSITRRVVRNARRRGLTVLYHRQWGSRHRLLYQARRLRTRRGSWGTFRRQADTLVQHITVTNPPGRQPGDFKAAAQLVEAIGVSRFGSGVSYNFLVDMATGRVAVGQPLDSKGTHTVNDRGVPGYSHDQNLVARAIAVIGQPDTPLSDKAAEAIAQLSAAMVEEKALTVGYDYVPHSLLAPKDCPCDPTRSRMDRIRARVRVLVREGGQ